MKKVLGIIAVLLSVLMIQPVFAKKDTKKAEEDTTGKVKVYVFEAGGCPFCEKEVEYLKGLKGYKDKFVIVRKELYVDHIDWAKGKDYDLGVKVAETFQNAGFTEADYNGTPFVVISDIYAATAYSDNLEEYINQAYEAGDKDAVSCIEKGTQEVCVEQKVEEPKKETKEKKNYDALIITGIVVVLLGGIAALIIVGRK